MTGNDLLRNVLRPYEREIKRVSEDNKRMRQSSAGAEDMIDLLTGKEKKPRAVRDWERNSASW